MSTDAPGTRPGQAGSGRRLGPLTPMWRAGFRDPVVEGHLRLDGLGTVARQLARVGVVTLVVVLVGVLSAQQWRTGPLLPADLGGALFLPAGLLPVSLVALAVAWVLILWGAMNASWPVRVGAAALFVVTNSFLSAVPDMSAVPGFALAHGPALVRTFSYVPPLALLASAVMTSVLGKPARWTRAALRLVGAAGVIAFYATHLWIHVAFQHGDLPSPTPGLLSGTVEEIDSLLVPLVVASAVLIIDFSLAIAEGAAESAGAFGSRVARGLLVVVLGVKLWFVLLAGVGDWATYAVDRPATVVRTVAAVGLLAVVTRAVTRFAPTEAFAPAKEWLVYGSSVGVAVVLLVSIVVAGGALFVAHQLGLAHIPGFAEHFPTAGLQNWGMPVVFVAAVITGVVLWRRGDAWARELGSGLIVLGTWLVHVSVVNRSGWSPGFSDQVADIVTTLGVLGLTVLHWRRLDASSSTALLAVTVFYWLAFTRGDWLAIAGGLLQLTPVVVVVAGVLFTILSGAGFAASSTRSFPSDSRVLLFVGYLVLSATILLWVEATHAAAMSDQFAANGFFLVGIPAMFWLAGRRLIFPAARHHVAPSLPTEDSRQPGTQ